MTYDEVENLFVRYPVASTWNSTNPQAIYFDTRKTGNWKSRALHAPDGGERYIKIAFADVAPHIEKTGRSNSENVFYRLRQLGDPNTLPPTEIATVIEPKESPQRMASGDQIVAIDDGFISQWHPQYDRIAGDEIEYQRLLREVARDLGSTGTISKDTFRDIWGWKGALRVIRHTTIYLAGYESQARTQAEDEYQTRYAQAFRRAALEPPERKLNTLIGVGVKLPGVEAATGSTVIHLMHPETMPIMDVRTISVLFEAGLISTRAKDLNHYEEFRRAIAGIRSRCPNWSLRQIDRALFAYDTLVLEKRALSTACGSG